MLFIQKIIILKREKFKNNFLSFLLYFKKLKNHQKRLEFEIDL